MPIRTTVFACIAWCALALSARADSLADVVAQVRPAVVGVGVSYLPGRELAGRDRYRFLGTGFAVGDGSIVVTSAHLLSAASQLDSANGEVLSVFVGRGDAGQAVVAEPALVDERHDLALLRLASPVPDTLGIGDSSAVREGDAIALTGFPLGIRYGLYPVTHSGTVSMIAPVIQPVRSAAELTAAQLQRARTPFPVFQLDATAFPGNSGSPVYDARSGRVVGVLSSVLAGPDGAGGQAFIGISHAVPAAHLKNLLARLQGGR